jgi:hypothetical protein
VRAEGLPVRQEFLLVAAITLAAAALRLYGIDNFSLHGDEFGSVQEASGLGLHLNSIPYFWILHAWTHLGSSDFMLRLPAALLGTLAIPVIYLLGKELLGSWAHGALTALLTATSAYAIEYSQQVRFYTLFLLASCLAFLAFARCLRKQRSRGALSILIGADLLCIASHPLGFVVVLVQLAHIAGGRKRGRVALLVACFGLFASLGLAELRPEWFAAPFHWLSVAAQVAGEERYLGPRGLQASSVAKIPIALFFYLFGMSVYPGTLWLVLPGLSLFAFLAVRGVLALRKRQGALRLVGLWICLPMFLLFVVFDAVVPQSFVGADSRYAICVLIAVQLIISAGIMSFGRFWALVATLCFAVVGASLAFYYHPSWSHTDRLGDWRAAARYVESRAGADAIVLYDGRSREGVTRYFPAALRREPFWNYLKDGSEGLRSFSQVFFVSDDSKNENRQDMNRFLKSLQSRFFSMDSYAEYPLFVLAMRRIDLSQSPTADRAGAVPVPAEVYGMEFADLALPRTARFAGSQLRIVGGFSTPGPDGEPERVIEAAGVGARTSLIVLSSLVNAGAGPPGRPVAELIVQSRNQEPRRFLLRQGVETNDWSQPCPEPSGAAPACAVADSWKKRLALVGRMAYPGAWREFDARIFGAKLEFAAPTAPDEIKVRYLLDRGYLQIWGMEMVD